MIDEKTSYRKSKKIQAISMRCQIRQPTLFLPCVVQDVHPSSSTAWYPLSSPSSRNMACQLLLGFKVDNVSVYTSALLISLHTPDYEAEVTENNLTINSTVLGFSTVHSEVFLWSSCCSFWRNGKKNSSIGWMNYFLTRAHSWAISEHLKTHTVSKWRVQKRRHQTVYVYCTIMVTQRTIECTLSTRELKMGAKRFGEETTISVHPERGG